jgi:hypothetical protein
MEARECDGLKRFFFISCMLMASDALEQLFGHHRRWTTVDGMCSGVRRSREERGGRVDARAKSPLALFSPFATAFGAGENTSGRRFHC